MTQNSRKVFPTVWIFQNVIMPRSPVYGAAAARLSIFFDYAWCTSFCLLLPP